MKRIVRDTMLSFNLGRLAVLLLLLPLIGCTHPLISTCGELITSVTSPAPSEVQANGSFDLLTASLQPFVRFTDPTSGQPISIIPTLETTTFLLFDGIPSGTRALSFMISCNGSPATILNTTVQVK
jgi:hypothetical protein